MISGRCILPDDIEWHCIRCTMGVLKLQDLHICKFLPLTVYIFSYKKNKKNFKKASLPHLFLKKNCLRNNLLTLYGLIDDQIKVLLTLPYHSAVYYFCWLLCTHTKTYHELSWDLWTPWVCPHSVVSNQIGQCPEQSVSSHICRHFQSYSGMASSACLKGRRLKR